jgi:hypothetical protein
MIGNDGNLTSLLSLLRDVRAGGNAEDTFHAKLKEAYEQQLRDHENSMASFLQRIATLCEAHATSLASNVSPGMKIAVQASPNSLARAVRNFAEQQLGPGMQMTGRTADTLQSSQDGVNALEVCEVPDEKPTNPGRIRASHQKAPTRMSKQPMKGVPEGCPVLQSSPPVQLLSPSMCDSAALQRADDALSHSLSRKTTEIIQEEFIVPLLPFIAPSGKVDVPLTRIEQFWNSSLDAFMDGCATVLKTPCLRTAYYACCAPSEGRLRRLVDSFGFKLLSATMIMANYGFIIFQTDHKMTHVLTDPRDYRKAEPTWMVATEAFFTLFYLWELCCTIMAHRKDFFVGHDMWWNLFDFLIVLVSTFELLMTIAGGESINLSFLRVLRFFKISRVLRMFSAARFVKEIRIMVDALTGSLLIFFFCCAMLAMFLSIFSIFFVQGMTGHLEDLPPGRDMSLRVGIAEHFGSVSDAMCSLWMAITGGNDWDVYRQVLSQVGPLYEVLLLFFIAFGIVAFLNVITGVFAEKAMSLAVPTVSELMERRKEKEVRDSRQLVKLLAGADCSGNHTLTKESFEDVLQDERLVTYLEVRGISLCSARRFFAFLLELHNTTELDFGTFVSSCVRLDDHASQIDLHILSADVKSIQLNNRHLQQYIKEALHVSQFGLSARTASSMSQDEDTSPACTGQARTLPASESSRLRGIGNDSAAGASDREDASVTSTRVSSEPTLLSTNLPEGDASSTVFIK